MAWTVLLLATLLVASTHGQYQQYYNATNRIAQYVYTFAGNSTGTGGTTAGDDAVLASRALFTYVVSVATDSSNNVYVADQGSRRIRVVNRRTQVITTFAGGGRNDGFNNTGGAATAAQLDAFGYGITAMVFDSSQNMYLVDANRVRFVRRTTMTISTVAGAHNLCCLSGGTGNNGPATAATFIQLTGLALDSSNNVYTADVYDNTVRMVQRPSGTIVAYAGTTQTLGTTGDGGKATAALLQYPQGIAVDRWALCSDV